MLESISCFCRFFIYYCFLNCRNICYLSIYITYYISLILRFDIYYDHVKLVKIQTGGPERSHDLEVLQGARSLVNRAIVTVVMDTTANVWLGTQQGCKRHIKGVHICSRKRPTRVRDLHV